MNSIGPSIEKQMKYFILIKSEQQQKYSMTKSVNLILALSILLSHEKCL